MKKALKIIGIGFIALFLLLLILPFFFKGTIVKNVNEAANKSLNAKFEVEDFSLSLLRSFPDFSLGINGLSLKGVDAFEKDTLVSIPDIYVTVDLFSVFKGSNYEVKSITIKNPRFLLKALKDGRVNWDIMKPSKDLGNKPSTSNFKLTLQKIKIVNGHIVYDDAGLNMVMKLEGVNNEMKGDLAADLTTLSTRTNIDELTVDYGGVRYFNKTKAELISDLDADMKNMKFTFKTGDILLNTLSLKLTGWFAMPEKGYDMDMKFGAPNSEFKNFLSLVPAIYSKNFKDLKSSGSLSINGFVKGHYSEASMPGFGADIKIEKGMFQYPGLPAAVNNVNLKASIINPSGIPDATVIDVSALHFQVLNNAMDVKMHVTTPVSDPHITASAKGKLNLADLRKVYPMEQTAQLSGKFDMDVQLDGKQSSIEKGRYQEFKAAGYMLVEDLKYGGKEVPKPVDVKYARLDFSPSALNLSKAEMKIGSSDLKANGKIENYLGYYFNKGKLKGTISTTSDVLNLNELMASDVKTTSAAPAPSTGAIAIPENIDFVMNTSIKKLIYSKMDIQNVNGNITVGNSKAMLNNLKMNMLNGDMTVNGSYDTKDPKKPVMDFDLNINAFDIQKAANTFTALTKFAPIAQKAAGLFSSKLKFKTELGADMMPVMGAINSSGSVMTQNLRIDNVNTLDKLAAALKLDKLKSLTVDKINLYFELVNGKLFVKPFDFTALGMKANLGGSTSLDKSIDYVLALDIPRKEFGGAANTVLNNLVSQVNKKGTNFSLGETVRVNVLIGGTLTNPVLKTGLKEAMGNVAEDLKSKALAELSKKKTEAASKALDDANIKAKALIDQAVKQSDAIMNDAKALAEKTKADANIQIDKLSAEADKKGPLASFAAKKVGDKLKKEAENKSSQIITEAQKRCDDIVNQARQQSDQLKKDAAAKGGL